MRNWILVLIATCLTVLLVPSESAYAWPRPATLVKPGGAVRVSRPLHGSSDGTAVIIYVRTGHHRGPQDDPYRLEAYFKKRKALKEAAEKAKAEAAVPDKKAAKSHAIVKPAATATDNRPKRKAAKPVERQIHSVSSSQKKRTDPKVVAPNALSEPLAGAE